MVRAEAGSGGGDADAGRAALVVDEGHHLVGDVGVVQRLHVAAVPRVGLLVVPGLVVHRVRRRTNFTRPAVDVVGEGVDHALAGVLVLVAAARGKDQDGRAVVPVDVDAHPLPEPGGMPAVALDVHVECVLRGRILPRAGGRGKVRSGAGKLAPMVVGVGGDEAQHLVGSEAAEVGMGEPALAPRPSLGESRLEQVGVGAQARRARAFWARGAPEAGSPAGRGPSGNALRSGSGAGRASAARCCFQKETRIRGGSPSPWSSLSKTP